ncbi:dUTP diphosphatase [Bacillus weihaiensis]|uniref:dUTP diphosphatase n=1 Tax=Bacillus weihaiensis TaxID=1547283 RepID=UPI002358003A|nr:dUTP diphosphatase [Bacillus weihaiensis]
MNLKKLFDMQRVLDQRILEKHPELKRQNNLDWKVLALQVELGECANEHRGFKKWSNNQEPRIRALKAPAMMEEDKEYYNPLLEEYVDCLHFILSIGIELGITDIEIGGLQARDATRCFLKCFENINSLYFVFCVDGQVTQDLYERLFGNFIMLGKSIGFTEEQIESAYFEKNAINHQRQEQGY